MCGENEICLYEMCTKRFCWDVYKSLDKSRDFIDWIK